MMKTMEGVDTQKTKSRRGLGMILAGLLGGSLGAFAAPVLQEDFESVFEDLTLKERFDVGEASGNSWRVLTEGGAANSVGVSLPGGQATSLTIREKVPGFAGSGGLTVTLDTRMLLRWDGGLPFSLPFAVSLRSPADPKESVQLNINYEGRTGGEETEYAVSMKSGGSFTWHPASLFENYSSRGGSSPVSGWLRWVINWRYEEAPRMIRAEVTVMTLGEEGLDEPTKVQTWTFDPFVLPNGLTEGEVELSLSGRAREGYGIDRVDNIVIQREPAPKENPQP